MATLWEMTVFSWSSNSWKFALSTFLGTRSTVNRGVLLPSRRWVALTKIVEPVAAESYRQCGRIGNELLLQNEGAEHKQTNRDIHLVKVCARKERIPHLDEFSDRAVVYSRRVSEVGRV